MYSKVGFNFSWSILVFFVSFGILLLNLNYYLILMTVEKIASLSSNIRFLIHFWSSSTKVKCGNSLYHPLQQANLWLISTTQLCRKCLVHCYEMRCNNSVFHNLFLSHLNSVCATFFAFSYCSWGSQGQNTEVICHSLLQWTTFCQTSPPWPVHLGWP